MIIKRRLIKDNINFIRVRWRGGTYICRENKCAFSTSEGFRSSHPMCDFCALVRSRYTRNDYLRFETDSAFLYYPSIC